MTYTIKAHPTLYSGVMFRSRLEARWAAFFDLCGWEWRYEPIDMDGWVPDFWLKIPCGHSECNGSHELYIEVKPFQTIKEFSGHAVTKVEPYEIPSPAMFGIDPSVTSWEMGHGAGGGEEDIIRWIGEGRGDWKELWAQAGNLVQWKRGG